MSYIIDLFAGCGGLSLGFHQQGFHSRAFVEWDKACINTLRANFSDNLSNSTTPMFYNCDIRNFTEYLDDTKPSLTDLSKDEIGITGVVGGPPCQAFSLAGRVRDPNGMKDDYRNYLFEAYCEVLKTIKPKFFVFENVVGMLSSKPNGELISKEIERGFKRAGYTTKPITKKLVYNLADYGGPQSRKRVIIFGVLNSIKGSNEIVEEFYKDLNNRKSPFSTVDDAIGDLDKLYPVVKKLHKRGFSHKSNGKDKYHQPRYHNLRDIDIFRTLAKDAKLKHPKYNSIESLKQLYFERVGKTSSVHKYNVLKSSSISNLIPAHLYKDGLRHIHPDPKQARSITVREAARLQTFPDNFEFIGSRGDWYKMIGNAVPPLLANHIAACIKTLNF